MTIGILNLALGYAVAAALADPPPWAGWSLLLPRPRQRIRTGGPDSPTTGLHAADVLSSGPLKSKDPPVRIAGIDELPPEWLDQLAASGIVAKSYVEAAAHVLKLEVGRYREQLLTAENRARANLAAGDGGALKLLADDLQFINEDWLDKQSGAADMLAQRSGRLGEHEDMAKTLEQVLLDQAAQIRHVSTVLRGLEFAGDVEGVGKRLLEKLGVLVDSAHSLRDRMQDLLATLLRTGEQLQTLNTNAQLDHGTGLPNRIGVETIFDAWWREDPQRERPLTIAVIDIDRFARVNDRLGTRAGDRTIAAVAKLLQDIIRKDRGYDRLARLGGQSFFLFYGDTGPHNGLTAAERARQSIEATTFDDQGAEFELTVSCGVVEAGRTDSAGDALRRALETLRFAKKAGRNRCAIDEGKGASCLDPPQFPVKGRVINLGAE
jgi:diguanylate cyclase